MAADHIADMESLRPAFCNDKYSLLVIVGQPGTTGFVDLLASEIERGIRLWDVDLDACNLDEQLKLFISRHSAFFSEDLKALISYFRSIKKTGKECEKFFPSGPYAVEESTVCTF
ncbi:putative electromotor neuron-associated protein 1 [Triplophysa rosa]|uniref:Electromotor neuron-associated protein 1 n=1 Tax=Triplophysa rosa TaxID=992332 RepID=A0A9W7T226_TRIRA|nr:putative electromotor neuron-associated protein 1 [Triplophysa rosa]